MGRWSRRSSVSAALLIGAIAVAGCGGSSNNKSAYSGSSTSATSGTTSSSGGGAASGSSGQAAGNVNVPDSTAINSSTWLNAYVQNAEAAHFSAAKATAAATCVQQALSGLGYTTSGQLVQAVKADPAKAQAVAQATLGCNSKLH
jgi:hypothetical protein